MHVIDRILGVYKPNLNAGLIQQRHFFGRYNGKMSSNETPFYQARAGINLPKNDAVIALPSAFVDIHVHRLFQLAVDRAPSFKHGLLSSCQGCQYVL